MQCGHHHIFLAHDNMYADRAICPSVRLYVTQMDQSTRCQAVARIADRTASQHLSGSRDAIGHLTFESLYICHFLLVVLWNGVSKSSRFERLRSKRIRITRLTF